EEEIVTTARSGLNPIRKAAPLPKINPINGSNYSQRNVNKRTMDKKVPVVVNRKSPKKTVQKAPPRTIEEAALRDHQEMQSRAIKEPVNQMTAAELEIVNREVSKRAMPRPEASTIPDANALTSHYFGQAMKRQSNLNDMNDTIANVLMKSGKIQASQIET